MYHPVVPRSIDHMLPPAEDDDRVVKCIQLESEIEPKENPKEESARGMDVIKPIKPTASNGHRFILVAIDYFTKWVEAASYKAVTKKIKHQNSTTYRPQMNEVVEAANMNIKKILRKMVHNYKQWHDKLPFDLLGYHTTVRTSIGATPYLLVYDTEVVIPTEVEIPSLRIIQESKLSDVEWIRRQYKKLALIDDKRMNVVCHGQLYQNRMKRAFNKMVRSRQFTPGQLVWKWIFLHQDKAKGKFSPNWQGPYMVHRVLTRGEIIPVEMDREIWPKPINSDAVKRYYV
ncbi:uncharacterized protein [Nicotiana tomentosiformis]|uniref:uncharacterized protein n=1 Tax=Nicotiana tomentosiformis TaxID=4098 RepID=UPI00388CDA3F